MKNALFTNFGPVEFTGWWDGKSKKFKPGQSLYMPDYLAKHFAKHLVNQELLRKDKNGNLLYPDGERMTSPKKPEDVPLYMELFNKAYTPDDEEQLGDQKDDIDTLIAGANKNREEHLQDSEPSPKPKAKTTANKESKKPAEKQDPTKPQYIGSPDDDEDEDEEEFQGKPVE